MFHGDVGRGLVVSPLYCISEIFVLMFVRYIEPSKTFEEAWCFVYQISIKHMIAIKADECCKLNGKKEVGLSLDWL